MGQNSGVSPENRGGRGKTREFLPVNRGKRGKTREFLPVNRGKRGKTREFPPDNRGGRGDLTEWITNFPPPHGGRGANERNDDEKTLYSTAKRMARQLFPRAGTAGGLRGAVVHRGLVLRDGARLLRPDGLRHAPLLLPDGEPPDAELRPLHARPHTGGRHGRPAGDSRAPAPPSRRGGGGHLAELHPLRRRQQRH